MALRVLILSFLIQIRVTRRVRVVGGWGPSGATILRKFFVLSDLFSGAIIQ